MVTTVVVGDINVESVPASLTKKCCMSPQHEMAAHAEKINGPAETTVALIENRTTTAEDVCSPDVPKAFHRLVIARTVCHWSAPVNKTAMVQMANPSSRCLFRRTSQCELQEVRTQFRKWDRRPVTNSVARPER